MDRLKVVAISFALVASVSGCGTIMGRHDGATPTGIYPATRFDFITMFDSPFPVPLLIVLDVPVSLVTDTIMLPADLGLID